MEKAGKFYKCFSKVGGNFSFYLKMLNFLSFLVLLYVSGHFKQKKNFKIFQTDRKISSPIYVVVYPYKLFPWKSANFRLMAESR